MPMLEQLSAELVELVLNELDLRDICSIRLCNRALSQLAFAPRYAICFKRKRLLLATPALSKMYLALNGSNLGSRLHELTIVGLATQEGRKMHASGAARCQTLLTKIFVLLKQQRPDRQLPSLLLTVAAMPNTDSDVPVSELKNWRSVWQAASSTFEMVLDALDTAELPVSNRFAAYSDVKGCSLEHTALNRLEQLVMKTQSSGDFGVSIFSTTRQLAVSLSSPAEHVGKSMARDEDRYCSAACLEQVTRIIKHMPALTELKVHWFRLQWWYPPAGASRPTVPRPIIGPHQRVVPGRHSASAPKSTSRASFDICEVRGFSFPAQSLMVLLELTDPSRVRIDTCKLDEEGSVGTIIRNILPARSNTPMESLYLNDIEEDGVELFFNMPGAPKYPMDGPVPVGPSMLTRQGQDILHPISYHRSDAYPMDSRQSHEYFFWRSLLYGSISSTTYDFIDLNATRPRLHPW